MYGKGRSEFSIVKVAVLKEDWYIQHSKNMAVKSVSQSLGKGSYSHTSSEVK